MWLYSSWSAAQSADVSSVRSADVSDPGTARLRGSGLLAPWHRIATVGCSMPASKNVQLFHFVQPLKMVQDIKAGGPLDLNFWSFLTFLLYGIEEVERHLL